MKRTMLHALKHGRLFRQVVESQWRSERLLILCYHGVSFEDEHEWKPSFSIVASDLEARFAMLRQEGYSVLPLDEAIQRLYARTLPRKSVTITFDDGLYNFYTNAWPLLKAYGYPATMYLTTYYCFQNLPVFPLICSYMFWKKKGAMIASNPAVGLAEWADLSTEQGRWDAWKAVQDHAEKLHMSALEKNDLARALANHLQLNFDEIVEKRLCHLMTPGQIREIASDGVDIQMHTHRHRSPMDRVLFQKEIQDNREKIQALTGRVPNHHCYPSGLYNAAFLPWLTEQNVKSATTCDSGFADADTHPLLLPRFLDGSNVSPIEFESWVSGVGAFVPKNPFRRMKHGETKPTGRKKKDSGA